MLQNICGVREAGGTVVLLCGEEILDISIDGSVLVEMRTKFGILAKFTSEI